MTNYASAAAVGAEVARTMGAMSVALESSRKEVLRDIAKRARADLRAAATRVPGGDRRFSQMGGYNHGGRLDVTFSTRQDMVFIGSKGPWKIAEAGAAPHSIGRWRHPGTMRSQGLSSWSGAADPIVSQAETRVPDAIGDAVEEAFGG